MVQLQQEVNLFITEAVKSGHYIMLQRNTYQLN